MDHRDSHWQLYPEGPGWMEKPKIMDMSEKLLLLDALNVLELVGRFAKSLFGHWVLPKLTFSASLLPSKFYTGLSHWQTSVRTTQHLKEKIMATAD